MGTWTYDKRQRLVESNSAGISTERKLACLNCSLNQRNVRRILIFHPARVPNVQAGSLESWRELLWDALIARNLEKPNSTRSSN